jgi:hypothetical protein
MYYVIKLLLRGKIVKKMFLIIFIILGFLSKNIYSQEIIWSTVELDVKNSGKHINLIQVEEYIMALYSKYNYFYDDTGYDIDYFLQAFGPGFMIAHLPKSAMAMKVEKSGYEQVQVLIFVLHKQYRIAGCLLFTDDGRGQQAIEANENNKNKFRTLLNSIWFNIEGIDN